jgi:NADPH:quinone reductase
VVGGQYQFLPDRPFIPGKLPAGTVSAVGANVPEYAIGDRVLALAEQGGYAQKISVPSSQCFKLPAAMSFIDAAAMALVYDTSWFALRERGRLKAGDVVLVLGASGGVGLAAVQLAKAMGARVLAAIARPEKADLVRDAGAHAIIDLSAPDLREDLRQQVYAKNGGNGVDIVIDPIGGDAFDAALRAVAWRGRVVVVGFASGRIPTIKANYLLLKNIEVNGLQVSDYRKRTPELMADCMQEIFTLFEGGKLRPSPAISYRLDQFTQAMHDVQNRRVRGRAVIVQDA